MKMISGLFLGTVVVAFSQGTTPPTIAWQQSYGGSGSDILFAIQPTSDKGFLFGGESSSPPSGNKTSPHFGGKDFWIVRVDAQGNKLWERSFGGAGTDLLYSIQPASGGGFLLGGQSTSPVSGNKTAANLGGSDFWVVRVDANGDKLWDRSYGAAGTDLLFSLAATSDGGHVLGGYSTSGVGSNKTSANFGGGDFWVVRIDTDGNRLWDRSFGGTGEEGVFSLAQTSDGGFILAGDSDSTPSGNKSSENLGGKDFWIVRLDANGNKLWDRSFGGTNEDADYNLVIRQTSDGGYLVGGDSFSGISGNKTSANFGNDDFWVVRVAQDGSKIWDRSFGGTGSEYLTSLQQASDGGFMLGGGTTSAPSGNKTAPLIGSIDYFLVRIDSAGSKLWDASYGGLNEDGFLNVTVQETDDGGFIVGGDSNSGVNGLKTTPALGEEDFWVLRLQAGGTAPAPELIAPRQTAASIVQQGFRFFIEPRELQKQYVAEYSTNLRTWIPVQTNLATTGQIEIRDPGAATSPYRFYRAYRVP